MLETVLSPGDGKTSRPPRRHIIQNGVAALFLIATAVLLARTASEAFRDESINAPLPLTPFATEADRAAHLHDVVDTFATGDDPGDRVMVIRADGNILFSVIGPLSRAVERTDTYQIGERGKDLYLATSHSGMIQALSIDQLSYFDDVYHRRSK